MRFRGGRVTRWLRIAWWLAFPPAVAAGCFLAAFKFPGGDLGIAVVLAVTVTLGCVAVREAEAEGGSESEHAVARVRELYARDEIDIVELERRIEHVLREQPLRDPEYAPLGPKPPPHPRVPEMVRGR